MSLSRHRVIHLFRRILDSWPDAPAPTFDRSPEDIAADFQASPPRLSPALAARLNAERSRARLTMGAADR